MASKALCVVSTTLVVCFLLSFTEAASIARNSDYAKAKAASGADEVADESARVFLKRLRRSPESSLTNRDARNRDRRAKAQLLDTLFGSETRHHYFNACIDLFVEKHGHHRMLSAVKHCMLTMP